MLMSVMMIITLLDMFRQIPQSVRPSRCKCKHQVQDCFSTTTSTTVPLKFDKHCCSHMQARVPPRNLKAKKKGHQSKY